MMLKKKRAFLLHHSLHTSPPEMMTNGLRRNGLVLDILKCFGNLNCIFSFASADELNGMLGISGGNEGWTTTR
jgi:hypothetical protein